MTTCVFCGIVCSVDSCTTCTKRYLRCGACGYVNEQYVGKMTEILRLNTWLGMPNGCKMCGVGAINYTVKAVGLPQDNFIKLSASMSYIRRRLCKNSQSST